MGHSRKKKKNRSNSTKRESSISFDLQNTQNKHIAKIHKLRLLRDLNFWFGVIGVVGTIIGIFGFLLYLSDKEASGLEKRKAAMTGILSAKQRARAPEMIISAGGAHFFIPNGILFTEGSDPLVWLTNKNSKILVSANIRNAKGELIAELRDNEWTLNKDQVFDRNYTDYAVEVRDKTGKVVLQVADLGEVIYFAGVLRCSNGNTFTVANTERGAVFECLKPGLKPHLMIKPIFDYPSQTHFGSCPGYEALKKRELSLTGKAPARAYMLLGGVDICGSQHLH